MSKDQSSTSLRQTFESALMADPDDLSAHMAYADWLSEQGDPRGEFIQVQLALEKSSGPQSDQLAQREQALLQEHLETWLGGLAEPFLEREDIDFRFRRGWLDDIQVGKMRQDLAAQLAQPPEIRLLRRLAVIDLDQPFLNRANAYATHVLVGSAWFEEDEEVAMVPLLESPYLGNVRIFQLGDENHERCDVGDGPIAGLIEKMPHLEVLHLFVWKLDEIERIFSMPLPKLRVLHVGGVFTYPVPVLAENPSLGALEDILLQAASPGGHYKLYPDDCLALLQSPHLTALSHLRMPFLWAADQVCENIVQNGLPGRLRTLELQYGAMTDAGAANLASCDLSQLQVLDLVGNHLTDEGIDRLRATGVNLLWETQTSPEPETPPVEENQIGPAEGMVRCEFCHEDIDESAYEAHRAEHLQLLEDGQQTDYATLPDEERDQGTLEGVPRVYSHEICGSTTEMPENIIRSYLANPYLYDANETFCTGCGAHVPFSECVWLETGEDLQSYMDKLRSEKPELAPVTYFGENPEELINECREYCPLPRTLDARESEECRLRLTPEVEKLYVESGDRLLSILQDTDVLYERGQLIWGHLVQANSALFDPDNPHTLPANILYSLEPFFDLHVAELGKIAQGLFALKDTVVQEPELLDIVESITNERERILRRALPASSCAGHTVYYATCFIQPDHLPDKHLAVPFFPLLAAPDETESVMILPVRYWGGLLLTLWERYRTPNSYQGG